MRDGLPSSAPQIEIGQPRLLNAGAVLILWVCGLVLMLPLLISILVISALPFGAMTFLVAFAGIAAVVLVVPLGMGNPYVAKLVRSQHPAVEKDQDGFIVQLSLVPRLRSGLRALAEDADDIGWLTFTESAVAYHGDSIKFSIPFSQVREVLRQGSAWGGLFLHGAGSMVVVAGLPGANAFLVAERSSWFLPASRKTSRSLHARLSSMVKAEARSQ